MSSTVFCRVRMVALVAGVCLFSVNLEITPAAAAPKEDPFLGVTPNWDKNLPSDSRFTILSAFGGEAVRDNNTGLVWEQAPNVTNRNWFQSLAYCLNKKVGGTLGWRLPSAIELASLIDLSLPAPFVSASIFTFTALPSAGIWSATTNASLPANAWYVDIGGSGLPTFDKSGGLVAWCVRGPMNADAY